MTHPTHDDAARFAADAAMDSVAGFAAGSVADFATDALCPTCANATGRGLTANANAGNSGDAPCPTCASGTDADRSGADAGTRAADADAHGISTRTAGGALAPPTATDALRTVASRPFSERADIEILRQRDVDLFAPIPPAQPTTFTPSIPSMGTADVEFSTMSTMSPPSPVEPRSVPMRGPTADGLATSALPAERVVSPFTESPIVLRTREVDLFAPPTAAPPATALPALSSEILPTPTLDFERISYNTRIREIDLYALPASSESSITPTSPFSPLEHTRSRLDTRTRLYDIAAQPNIFDEIIERLHSGESYESGAAKWAHLRWSPDAAEHVKPIGLTANWESTADGQSYLWKSRPKPL